MPTIFLRIAWMNEYKGVTNFYPIDNDYYGYARVPGGKNIRLERLGATKEADFIEDVTIIFFAKDPERGGQYILGWYKGATLYRKTKRLKTNSRLKHYNYQAVASIRNSKLIKPAQRLFPVPANGPGQSNVWYVEEYQDKSFLKKVEEYITNPVQYFSSIRKRESIGSPWQKNIEIRKKVENEAMKIVADYFEIRGYTITYVQDQNLGWDLNAVLGKQKLLLEVKGLSGEFVSVELTHNEYANSMKNKKHYRICIVSNVLDKEKRLLDIFYRENKNWVNNQNIVLNVKELTSARFYK
jgi:hypothetical protein